MPRFVLKKAKGPFELKPQAKSTWICMCGLSQNQPFCDSSHTKTADEKDDEMYLYDTKTGKRVADEDDDEKVCCGGKCCKKPEHGSN